MALVFGYGSLLNPASAARTLKRPVGHGELCCGVLHGFLRSWTAATRITLCIDGEPCCHQALFLDLTPCAGSSCNGVCLEVTDSELQALDLRERGYERRQVEVEFDGRCDSAWTYLKPGDAKQYQGIIAACYIDLIKEALQHYPDAFVSHFWASTLPTDAAIVQGEYIFADCEQNRAAGRQLTPGSTGS
ncbi:MAG: gamma-glutamylcyclotransferase [Thiothrix sp.]|nr:gamma-glutamylcyclotransferase [Thiothrix sp.]HPE62159.1 gamma-glutamylcyclotransferase [Thiolinea sp.]